MPMTAAGLAAAMSAAQGPSQDTAIQDAANLALANAIIPYIQTNAVVTVASVSGVTPGGGASGPGAGTIA